MTYFGKICSHLIFNLRPRLQITEALGEQFSADSACFLVKYGFFIYNYCSHIQYFQRAFIPHNWLDVTTVLYIFELTIKHRCMGYYCYYLLTSALLLILFLLMLLAILLCKKTEMLQVLVSICFACNGW